MCNVNKLLCYARLEKIDNKNNMNLLVWRNG